jgi:two-component SAPR family response regulator
MPDALRSIPQISQTPAESKPCISLAGKRILVVEDDGLIALDIISELRRAGCTAIGPASRLETAMTMAAAEHIDAAVLDVFLGGAYAWQLAGTLKAQGVPFLFQTGFGRFLDFPVEFASVPRLEKPVMTGVLKRELKALLA